MRRVYLVLAVITLMGLLVLAACGGTTTTSQSPSTTQAATDQVVTTSQAASTTTAQGTQKELVVGVLAGLSGSGSESMSRLLDGFNFAVEYINGKGGITVGNDKYIIKPVVEDYKMTMDGMIAAANKLVSSDKVPFMITLCAPPPFTSMAASIAEKNNSTNDNKVLTIHSYAVGMKGEYKPEQIPYTFFTYMDWPGTQATLDSFAELYPSVKTIAYVSVEDPASHDLAKAYDAVLAGHDIKQVGSEYYEFGTTDYYPALTKILGAKPDAILLGLGFPEWQGAILKQARELGFKGSFVTPGGGSPPDVILKVAGAGTTDYLGAAAYLEDPALPAAIGIIRDMAKAKGLTMVMDYLQAWDTMSDLAAVIEKAGSVDPTEVKNAWETIGSIDTSFGPATMGGQEYYGLKHAVQRPFAPARIMDGKISNLPIATPVIP